MDELFGSRAIRLTDSLQYDVVTDPQPFDTPPVPVGGIAAIGSHIIYPESAKHDSVKVGVFLFQSKWTARRTKQCKVVRSIREDLDSAAVVALREIRFSPAIYQGEPVGTTIMVPIEFKLN